MRTVSGNDFHGSFMHSSRNKGGSDWHDSTGVKKQVGTQGIVRYNLT